MALLLVLEAGWRARSEMVFDSSASRWFSFLLQKELVACS